MSEAQYTISGREVYSARGKLVATLDDDGNPVMAPGMAGPHSRAVREFLAEGSSETPARSDLPDLPDENEQPETPEPEEGGTTVYVGRIPAARPAGGAPAAPPPSPGSVEEYSISTIPDDALPPFSSEYGIFTPGFLDFCEKHKLSAPQRAALVARLQNKTKGKRNA